MKRKKHLFLKPSFILTLKTFQARYTFTTRLWFVDNNQEYIQTPMTVALMLPNWTNFTPFVHAHKRMLQSLQEWLLPKSVSCKTVRHKCAWQKHTYHICCTLEKGANRLKTVLTQCTKQTVSVGFMGYSEGVRGHWLCFCPESFSVCRRECRPGPYTLPPRHTHSVWSRYSAPKTLLLYYNKRQCSGQSQIPSHDAWRRQRVGRGSVEGGGRYWSLCSSTAPCSAPAQTERGRQSSPCGFAQTTWSVWGAAWEHEAVCEPSAVFELQSRPPALNRTAVVCCCSGRKHKLLPPKLRFL